jgi:DNA-binding MarR family transcriptional regulator
MGAVREIIGHAPHADTRADSACGLGIMPLESTVGHLLRRAQQAHTAIWAAEFGGDLTGPQYAMLSVLTRRPALDQRTAGNLASLDKSNAADIIARLERKGWVAREPDEAAPRRNRLTLTPAARAALPETTRRADLVQERLVAPLDPAERADFTRTLAIVAFDGRLPPGEPTSASAPSLRLATTPGHLLRRAEQVHRRHWTRLAGRTLTPTQYELLSSIVWNPGIDQSTAGDLASLDKSSTTGIVARLARRGQISVTRDDRDRRSKTLALTEAAWAVLAEARPAVEQVQRDLLAPLSAPDADHLVRCLHDVAYREP